MKIYLYASFPCKIIINEECFNMEVGEALCLTGILEGCVKILPESNNLEKYEVDLKSIIKSSNIKCLKIGCHTLFCQLIPKVTYSIENENYLIQKNFNVTCLIRYFVGEYSYFSLFINNFSIKRKMYNVKSCFSYTKKVQNEEFLFVVVNMENKNYLFLVKDDKLLWEGCFKEINVLEKEILILEDNESCLGEKLVIKYIVSDKKFEKYPVVYKKKKLEFLSPVPAFLDCIMLHNYTQMKKLVSDDLIDFCCEKINDFCGDFDDYIFIENFCVLTKNFEAQKVLCFKISNNLIVDIID